MNVFFDTSALVKFFNVEQGNERVTELILNRRNRIFISELARLQIYSALYRKFRNHQIDNVQLNEAISGFNDQLVQFNLESMNQLILDEAGVMLQNFGKNYGLRTLDAIHLATFSLIAEKSWVFVCSDDILGKVVKELGFKLINPVH
jgi:predicted nucleic acid-binding protein